MDAFVPGVDQWESVYNNPQLWHFRFHGETPEQLVLGRERMTASVAVQKLQHRLHRFFRPLFQCPVRGSTTTVTAGKNLAITPRLM
jgi:hypothetical protein